MDNQKIIQRLGETCYSKLLDACHSNTTTENRLLEIARQISRRIFGKVTQCLEKSSGFEGRSSMKSLLEVWNQHFPNRVYRNELFGMKLYVMAYDMAESVDVKLKWALHNVIEDNETTEHLIFHSHLFLDEEENNGYSVQTFEEYLKKCANTYPKECVSHQSAMKNLDILDKLKNRRHFIQSNIDNFCIGDPVGMPIKLPEKYSCLRKVAGSYSLENVDKKDPVQEKRYKQHLQRKDQDEEKKKTGLSLTSNNKVSMLTSFMMIVAKVPISKMFIWGSIFSVLTGLATCSLSSTSGDLEPVEFQLSEFITSHEIPLPTFSFYVDYEAATIEKTEITDSMEGCQLILHIEISHVEGIHSDKIGETVFYAEHPNLGCGLQKFSMLSDERNIWKEKRFCFSDCLNGVETPLLLSATTNLTEARNIIIVPEIRNDGCKTTEQPSGFLPTILFVTCSMIFLAAMVTLLIKEYGKIVVKTILNHQDGIIEKQRMIEENH